PGRHLFSGKARDENKGNVALHQNVRHGKGVMAVDAHVEQRGVHSLALDRLERALQGGDRTHDGPTAARRIVSISPAIIASSSTISTRRPARPTRGFPRPGSACPTLRRGSRFRLVGGTRSKAWQAMPP